MVYTATRGTLLAQGEDPKTFLKKQGLFVVLGVITMVVLAVFDYRRLEPLAMILYWLIVLSLLGVFVVGSSAQGAARWFSLGPLAVAALRVRRARPGPGHRLLLRAPRGRGLGLARRLPPPDHGRHPDRPRAAPARPGHRHDHDHRAAGDAGRGRTAHPHPGHADRRHRAVRARRGGGRPAAPLPDRPPDHVPESQQQEHQPLRAVGHLQPERGEERHRLGRDLRFGYRARGPDQPGLRARTADRLHLHRGGGAARASWVAPACSPSWA